MSDREAPGQHSSDVAPVFDERLAVPLWWWPLGFGLATLLAAEVHMGHPGVQAWLPYLLTVPLTCVVLWRMGRHRVALRGDELWVGPAHVPVGQLGQIQVISPDAKRRVLGPDLDPAAFVLHTGWVGPVLRVTLTDPADPTPYWVFSVRHAEQLAALLRAQTDEVPHGNAGPRSPSR